MGRERSLLLCRAIIALALVNFVSYVLIAAQLGGDAINGLARDGHYYLMSHGAYTEVSETVFTYSRWHAYSLWCTHPLGMLAMLWHGVLKRPSP